MTLTKPIEQRLASPTEAVFLPDDDNFPYGWRLIAETLPNGTTAYRRLPLTQADFLDPQEEDQMVQSDFHAQLSIDLYDRLRNRYSYNPTIGVFFDLKLRWDIPGLKGPAPDVAVVPNLRNKEANRSSFDVVKEGTRPCLIIEVISPHYPGDDTSKVEIYERAGVAEYIIINPHDEDETARYELWGYRLVGSRYQPIKPDERGRVLSQTTGLWFEVVQGGRGVVLTDAATGERLLTAEAEKAARLTAEAQAEAEAQARRAAEARAAALEARLRELEAKLGQSDQNTHPQSL